jgi:hypothetical protein
MGSLHDIMDVAGEVWFYVACGTILFGLPPWGRWDNGVA